MTDSTSFNVTEAHIVKTPGICGGSPRITGRRVRVYHVYVWHEIDGVSVDEIARQYDLTVAQVYAALTYAFEHIDEIHQEMREEETMVAESKQRHQARSM